MQVTIVITGLDAGRYRMNSIGDDDELAFGTLESRMPDSIRFKDADPFLIRCRACQGEIPFSPISEREVISFLARKLYICIDTILVQISILSSKGLTCPGCQAQLSTASIQIQLECQIRARIAKYYEMWTVCDDPMCRNRTRMMGVYGRRCLKPGCLGIVSLEVRIISQKCFISLLTAVMTLYNKMFSVF